MFFTVLQSRSGVPLTTGHRAYLIKDSWDDWFEFNTTYILVYVDRNKRSHNIGSVKIGQFNQPKENSRPLIPDTFNTLDDEFFSLGQDDSYYNNLNVLGDETRDFVLNGLNDVAKNEELFERALNERVTKVSLLRFVSPTSVRGQFRRLAMGGARLSRYAFKYTSPYSARSSAPPFELSFNVEPESNPPTNIHVLIGRNGVGKTHLLNNMINSLVDENAKTSKFGKFSSELDLDSEDIFANLVSVTFSAFDDSEPLSERKDKTQGIQYSYVGLKRAKKANETSLPPKSPVMLKNEFVKSVLACKSGGKTARWKRALEMLEADPIFREAEVANIANSENETDLEEAASEIFKKFSSGHKIVLLTITRLVETVEERTLVLLDEPEAHLHPPLLSAFIRALSDLLIQKNGVGIIATHSPVILQEVPRSCVWKLRRSGSISVPERLEIESFGENVGTLTREVFGLEVTHSGFHRLLTESVRDRNDYNEILNYFDNELGMEAKAILRSLLLTQNN